MAGYFRILHVLLQIQHLFVVHYGTFPTFCVHQVRWSSYAVGSIRFLLMIISQPKSARETERVQDSIH